MYNIYRLDAGSWVLDTTTSPNKGETRRAFVARYRKELGKLVKVRKAA